MKKVLAGAMCVAVLLSFNAMGGTPKGPGSDKKGSHEAKDDGRPKEKTLIGVVALSNDSITFTIKEKSGATYFVPPGDATKFHFADIEMLDVKAVCMLKNGDIASVKSVDVVDKAAWKNRQAELKEAADKAAAAKKAAAQPKQ